MNGQTSVFSSTCGIIAALLMLSASALAFPLGDEWVVRNQLPTNEDLQAAASDGVGTAVVVGNHGTVLSTTGSTWTQRPTSVRTDLQDVIWTGSKYVAVGYGGAILWSTNSEDWNVVPAVDAAFYRVTWTGTLLVAVGGTYSPTLGWTGSIFTSADAVTWTRRTVTGAPTFFGVSNKSGMIVAVANGVAFTSPNGTTWTKRTLPKTTAGTATVTSIVWTGSTFLLTGETVWTSADGIKWIERLDLGYLIGMMLRWTGLEIAATHPIGRYYTSANGLSWTDRSAGLISAPLSGGRFGTTLLYVSYGGHIEGLTPGGAWAPTNTTTPAGSVNGIASSGSLYVAVGVNVTWTSTDADTWTAHSQTNLDLRNVCWNGSKFVAVGNGAWTSTDGIAWTNTFPADTSGNTALFTVASALGKTVFCGYRSDTQQAISAVSTDGTTWSPANLPGVVLSFAFDGTKLWGVGWRGLVVSSSDGSTWDASSVPELNDLGIDFTSVVYGGGQFVATTGNGVFYTSATGASWLGREYGPEYLSAIVRTTNEFIALGSHGFVARSFDAINWRALEPRPTGNAFNRLLWTGSRLIATAASGNIFTSDGPATVQPTVTLSATTNTMPEAGGTATVTATLSQAWTLDVVVPLAFSGSSSAGTDYADPLASLFIPAGATTASLTLTATADFIDEMDESLIVTALAPTGDAVLGATTVQTITIVDDDTSPSFASPLADRLVTIGTPVVFNSPATGTGVISYQWKKNNAAITGAKAASYSIAKAALTNAGEYHVEAKNASATTPSNKVKLGVIALNNKTTVVKAGTIGTFTANAAGAVSYRWRHGMTTLSNGGRISGADTNKLVITGLNTGDTDIYVCDVTLGSLTLPASTIDFAVIDNVPAISPHAPLVTRVAADFDFTPTASLRPYKWAISNLPPGLTFNTTTGRITGKPTTTGTRSVKFIATNLYGPSTAVNIDIVVNALPAPTLGSFVALLPRHAVNGQLGGRVDVATEPNGHYTGKLWHGAASYSLNSFLSGLDGTDPTGHVDIVQPGVLPALDLDFSIDRNTGVLTATVTDGTNTCTGMGLGRAVATTNRSGAYTGAWSPAQGSPANTPEGHGYMQFSIAAAGTLTAAGRLADNTSYSIATETAADGTIPLFLSLYSGKGSIHGTLTLHEDAGSSYANNYLTGALTWSKANVGSGRSYAGGFPTITINADGGRYAKPLSPSIAMNLTAGTGNAKLRFTGANLNLATRNPDGDFTVASVATVTPPASNVAGTTLKFDLNTGLISGQFVLSDTDTSVIPNKALPRTVLYTGVVIRPGGLPTMKALGYFNLDQMPTILPKTTSKTSPQLSGAVTLLP